MIHTLEPYFTDEMICLSNDQVDKLNDQFELRPSKDDVFNGVSLFSKDFWAVTRGSGTAGPAANGHGLCDINRVLFRVT